MDSQTVRLSMDNKEDRYYYHLTLLLLPLLLLPTTKLPYLQYQSQ
jgi:hypothetical protein